MEQCGFFFKKFAFNPRYVVFATDRGVALLFLFESAYFRYQCYCPHLAFIDQTQIDLRGLYIGMSQ